MTELYKYGRSIGDRIKFLVDSLEGHERADAERQAMIYFGTIGKSFDQHVDPIKKAEVDAANNANTEALRNLDKIFVNKFGCHMVENKAMLGLSEDDAWPST